MTERKDAYASQVTGIIAWREGSLRSAAPHDILSRWVLRLLCMPRTTMHALLTVHVVVQSPSFKPYNACLTAGRQCFRAENGLESPHGWPGSAFDQGGAAAGESLSAAESFVLMVAPFDATQGARTWVGIP